MRPRNTLTRSNFHNRSSWPKYDLFLSIHSPGVRFSMLITRSALESIWTPVDSCLWVVRLDDSVCLNSNWLRRRCSSGISMYAPHDFTSRVLRKPVWFTPKCSFSGRFWLFQHPNQLLTGNGRAYQRPIFRSSRSRQQRWSSHPSLFRPWAVSGEQIAVIRSNVGWPGVLLCLHSIELRLITLPLVIRVMDQSWIADHSISNSWTQIMLRSVFTFVSAQSVVASARKSPASRNWL